MLLSRGSLTWQAGALACKQRKSGRTISGAYPVIAEALRVGRVAPLNSLGKLNFLV